MTRGESGNGCGLVYCWSLPRPWIPAFAGMTRGESGNDGWGVWEWMWFGVLLVPSPPLDSRLRGNDERGEREWRVREWRVEGAGMTSWGCGNDGG